MDFECYFCGKTFNWTEPVDIKDEQKHKYHVCMKCYIKGIDVILEGQYNELINRSVRHGRWIALEGWFNKSIVKCSVCGNTLDMDGVNAGRGDANFCPNCGARMDAIDTNVNGKGE